VTRKNELGGVFFFENWVIRPRREGELRGVEGVWEEKGRGLTGVGDKEMF